MQKKDPLTVWVSSRLRSEDCEKEQLSISELPFSTTESRYGDGYILLGFSAGYFVVISTHLKEIGQELFQAKNHRDVLNDIAISTSLSKAASCGDNFIKIHELTNLKESYAVVTVDDERGLDWLEWSDDGQLLAVASPTGNIHVYLTKLPVLGGAHTTRVAFLTSLLEVTVTNIMEKVRAYFCLHS
ncbi:WD repeat-containing protein 19 [Portunus trituberculatus]|uniref:WD repeat-containing protein 19 n=1 Tax=Portunus trituberculatus TaxID=210409 RepID=A0A5B7FPD2_PORTR|nr:WD repeat-containing protein 19 [Portunus trituberculatus]